jgi:DNA excision repair protein ERCC-6-like 2
VNLNFIKKIRLLVVTSFDMARRNIHELSDLAWSVVIVDEAHRLKNPKSQSTLAFSSFIWPESHPVPSHMKSLLEKTPGAALPKGPIRFALTGTAIQNSYTELWTLLDWVNPGSVGSMKQWKQIVAEPLIIGQAKGCSEEAQVKAVVIAQRLRDKLLPKYFLRRCARLILNREEYRIHHF